MVGTSASCLTLDLIALHEGVEDKADERTEGREK